MLLGDILWVPSRVLVQGQRECRAGIAGMVLAGCAGHHPESPARSAGPFLGQGFWGRGSPRHGGVSPHPQPCRAALSSVSAGGAELGDGSAARWSLCPSVHPSGLGAVHLPIRAPLRPSVRSAPGGFTRRSQPPARGGFGCGHREDAERIQHREHRDSPGGLSRGALSL